MKRHAPLFALVLLLAGCDAETERPAPVAPAPSSSGRATLDQWINQGQEGAPVDEPSPHGGAPMGTHAGTPTAPPAAPAAAGGQPVSGTVTETMDSGGYTYMNVATEGGPVWVATSQREMAVGTTVRASGMVMQNFRSNTLNRTFERLLLASTVDVL